jgi:DNA-binding transcriptional ArsR family regulator
MSKRGEARAARRPRPAAPGSARLFAALGDETRLSLVRRLCSGGPLSIARLTEGSAVSRQAVTKHLEVLSRAGLVRGSRRGRERVWRLEPARLDEARAWLDRVSAQWDAALERLRAAVEDEAGEA